MSKNMVLDSIHHLAICVADLESSISWYQTSINCELIYRDKSHAVLRLKNLDLHLVLPSSEQPHFAILREDAATLGELSTHPMGFESTVISDPSGNIVEVVKLDCL
jgi:catechol-2,3-dioxygenase